MHRRMGYALLTALGLMVAGGQAAHAAVPGTTPVQVKDATDLGAYSAHSMSVTVALKPRSGLDSLLASIASGATSPISASQFNQRFAPATTTLANVTAFATTNNLSVASVSANRMLVKLTGSSAAVAKAFGTSFESYRLPNGTTYHAPKSAATVPAGLASQTTAVLGLSNLGRASLPNHRQAGSQPSAGVSVPATYGPQDFWAMYHAPSSATGSGQTLAVIAEGDLTQVQTDLRTFESQFGLPQVPWTTVKVGGGSSDTSGQDEWDLDTQYSTGFAPNVSGLRVYDGVSLANTDIAAEINQWVTDNATKQASFSAGECEVLAQVSGFQDTLDNTLKQAAAQGQTLFTSSGDTGSFCPAVVGVNGVPAGVPNVNYPAASPYAIGVGGTTVVDPSGPTEVTWYGTGGGATLFESAPAFQSNAGGSFAGVNRGVPDVALDADPFSGYRVIVSGSETGIGGTSASAPAWQGIWARAQGAHGGGLGFAGPVLYNAVPRTAFHDIVAGANGLYPTTPGWDYNTGLGTADITAVVNGS
ncbi:MAG: protease pro-enzyme activation domain-containing protein [Gaiellaceae bacterium]